MQLYNTKDHAIVIKKGTAVAQMVPANEVPETVVANGMVGPFETEGGPKKAEQNSPSRKEEKSCWNSGLKSWMEENKEKALNILAEYYDIFTLEDGELGCTEAAEHKIEVTDPKPFKERPRNISSGLLEEVKEHLDHMLDVGAIKPSKSAWSNAVVIVWKRDGGLWFCIDF